MELLTKVNSKTITFMTVCYLSTVLNSISLLSVWRKISPTHPWDLAQIPNPSTLPQKYGTHCVLKHEIFKTCLRFFWKDPRDHWNRWHWQFLLCFETLCLSSWTCLLTLKYPHQSMDSVRLMKLLPIVTILNKLLQSTTTKVSYTYISSFN